MNITLKRSSVQDSVHGADPLLEDAAVPPHHLLLGQVLGLGVLQHVPLPDGLEVAVGALVDVVHALGVPLDLLLLLGAVLALAAREGDAAVLRLLVQLHT